MQNSTNNFLQIEANKHLISYCLNSKNLKLIKSWYRKTSNLETTSKIAYSELKTIIKNVDNFKKNFLKFEMILNHAAFIPVLSHVLKTNK